MRLLFVVLVSFLFLSKSVVGQSKDEAEIRHLEKHWTELLDKGDTTSLKKIWSEEYVVNNPNGKIVTPTEIIGLMRNGHVFPKVERNIEKITFNGNICIVMGQELQQPANMTTNKNEWKVRRFTNVWINSEKGWQLAARQSSEVCTD